MNKLLEPVALMSVALAGVIVFGIGHLVADKRRRRRPVGRDYRAHMARYEDAMILP